jgi:hypothetical protein
VKLATLLETIGWKCRYATTDDIRGSFSRCSNWDRDYPEARLYERLPHFRQQRYDAATQCFAFRGTIGYRPACRMGTSIWHSIVLDKAIRDKTNFINLLAPAHWKHWLQLSLRECPLKQPNLPTQKRLLFASQRVCDWPRPGAVPKRNSSDNASSR